MPTVSSGCLFYSHAIPSMISQEVIVFSLSSPVSSPRDPAINYATILFKVIPGKFVKKFDIAALLGAIQLKIYEYHTSAPTVPVLVPQVNYFNPTFIDDETFGIEVDFTAPIDAYYVLGQFPVVMFDETVLTGNVATGSFGTVPTPFPTLA